MTEFYREQLRLLGYQEKTLLQKTVKLFESHFFRCLWNFAWIVICISETVWRYSGNVGNT